jgi:hypothetical protein
MAYPNYYGQQNQPAFAPAPPTNGMAIAALVAALLFAPLGIIFGHIARSQIKRTGEGGRGLATAGLILGYLFTIIPIVIVVIVVSLGVFLVRNDHHTELPSTITEPSSVIIAPSSP